MIKHNHTFFCEKFAIDNNYHVKYFNQGPLKDVQYIEVKEQYLYD